MNAVIDEASREMMRQDSKIGVLATHDDEGYPHLTFISSIQGLRADRLTFGNFCVGLSKEFVKKRPDAGFLVLSPDMRWLKGFARYTHTEITGEVFDEYNNKPLFRYNSYFGFDTIYFFDLLGITDMQKLPMAGIVIGALASRCRALFAAKSGKNALSYTGKELFGKLDSLKFLCYVNQSEHLEIVPIVQATHAGSDRVVFAGFPYGGDLKSAPLGGKAAILCVNLQMQSVLVKGTLSKRGCLEIERVYNSMPIKNQYIYPKEKTPRPVTDF